MPRRPSFLLAVLPTLCLVSIAGCAGGTPTGTTGSAGSGATSTGGTGTGGDSTSQGGSSTSTGGSGGSLSTGGTGGSTSSTGGTSTGGGGAGPCGAPMCTGDLEWVRRYGPDAGQQFPYGMAVDDTGHATIGGGFNATLDLGEIQLTTAGGIDIFWAKVAPDATTVAAKRFGGAGNDLATGAAVDRKGNSAFYGLFSGTLDFGNGPLQAQNFRLFLARLDPSGDSLWSKAFGDTVNASSTSAGIDKDGNVVYGTGYNGDIDFGLGSIPGGPNAFVITKFSPAGQPLWSKSLASYMASSLAVAGDAGILVSGGGDMANPPDFGCGAPGAFRVLAKLDPAGTCVWQKAVVGPAIDAVVAEGPVFAVLGRFNGSGSIGDATISAPGGKSFIATFDNDGTYLWSFTVSDASVHLEALAIDAAGGVVFKGTLDNGTADFGGNVITGDSFLARLAPDGTWLWGKGFTGNASFPVSVGLAPTGHPYLYGRADGPLDFGSGVLNGGSFPTEDAVLARFKP